MNDVAAGSWARKNRWTSTPLLRVVKNVRSDRKLLGGVLLDYAKDKERVSLVVGSDRLLVELRRCLLDATIALLEDECLVLATPERNEES